MKRFSIILFTALASVAVYGQHTASVSSHQAKLAKAPFTLSSANSRVAVIADNGNKATMEKSVIRKVDGLSSMQRAVGYSNTDSITQKNVALGMTGTYPVGALLTSSILKPYEGCKVIGIRFALTNSIGRSRVFLNGVDAEGVLTGESIEQTQRTYEGWNNIFFNGSKSYEIKEGEDILVGFDYTETEEMVAADEGYLATVGEATGNEFLIYGNFNSGEGWYPITNVGALCVQLIVDVSSLPSKDLDIVYLDTGFRYKQRGENVDFYTTVANSGREDVNGYSVAYQIDEQAPVVIQKDETIKEGESDGFEQIVALGDNLSVGKHTFKVFVNTIEGAAPETNKNDMMESVFYIYENSFARQQHYVEQYTSQKEYLAYYVNDVFAKVSGSANNMCMANIYEPGNTLATADADYLTDLYAYTYPSFTIDRSYFPGEKYIAYDVNYYAQIGPDFVAPIIMDMLAQEDARPAFATVNITPSYNSDSRELSLGISGDVSEDASAVMGDLALTVLLTEDGVKAAQYVVNGNQVANNPNYIHNNVLRKFVSAPKGDKITVNGLKYSGNYTVKLDDSWNVGKMKAIAFVTRMADEITDANLKEMDITNANSFDLSDVTGIYSIEDNSSYPCKYYTIDGMEVSESQLANGIYILRQGSSLKKVLIKK